VSKELHLSLSRSDGTEVADGATNFIPETGMEISKEFKAGDCYRGKVVPGSYQAKKDGQMVETELVSSQDRWTIAPMS